MRRSIVGSLCTNVRRRGKGDANLFFLVFTSPDTTLRTGISPWLNVCGGGQLFDKSGLLCLRTAVEQSVDTK